MKKVISCLPQIVNSFYFYYSKATYVMEIIERIQKQQLNFSDKTATDLVWMARGELEPEMVVLRESPCKLKSKLKSYDA